MKAGMPGVPRNVRVPPPAADQASEAREPRDPTPGGPRRPWGRIAFLWARRVAVVLLALAVVAVVALVMAVRRIEDELPSVADLKGNYHPPQVTRVLARDGTLLAELFTERRTVVPIGQVPAHVKLAVLAAEDAGFYEHEGLNYWGMARAFLVNLRSRRTRQGGSTITQQVVKNLLLDSERTYRRKAREALLARRLEQELTKDEILELYLNHIFFGHGRYGIEEAARYHFGKGAKDLTIAEGALLAGLVAAPERFSPRVDLKKAVARRTYVLDQMAVKGFLTDAQRDAAKEEPVRVASVVEASSELAPEVVEIARRTLHELDPERARRGGFTITTTLDPRLQDAARRAVRANLQAYDKRHGLAGALKAPPPAKPAPATSADRKAKAPRLPSPIPARDAPFEGTPAFDQHRVLNGVVLATDDALGTLDVRVGTVTGSVRLSDYERYNPQHLPPSAFAPVGAIVRVSLLAPPPEVPSVPSATSATPSADAPPSSSPVALDGGVPLAATGGQPATPVSVKVPLRLEVGPESAFVAVDIRTRQVLALVGNYEAIAGGLDRATQARRQPGSTFKPIVYSYALHARLFTPASVVDVTPETFEGGYKPANYEGWKGTDPLRLREALANSVNLAAVRVLREVGPANVVSWGQSLGIRSTLKPDLSLALGSYEVQPLELVGAYATFASGGMYEEPRIITRILGPDGKEVPLKPLPPPRRVLDEAEAYLTTSLLSSVVDHGTAVRAKELRRPVAGKTGTSNSAKDTWFAGYSTDVAAVVWVGFDDGKPLGGETGASAALPAWIQFMKVAHETRPPSEFPRPQGLTALKIDPRTGKLPYDGEVDTLEEVFLAGTEPTEVAPVPPPQTVEDGGAAADDDKADP